VNYFHKKNKSFELNELREDNIYINENNIFIDQGYYNDCYDDQRYHYWISPEGIKSPENDLFSLGIIFFRLITLDSTNDINNCFYLMDKSKTMISKKYIKQFIGKGNTQYLNILKNALLKSEVISSFDLFFFRIKLTKP
jgi:hypothetical protein